MSEVAGMDQRYRACRADLESRGQEHVLRWWDELSPDQRQRLLADVESIPWEVLDPLIASHVVRKAPYAVPTDLRPAPVYSNKPRPENESLYVQAACDGRELIRAGKVAAFTVAGGQGTRLGFDGPKGMIKVTPVGDRTLFQLFAETIKAARRRYDTVIPWYVMTSPANHEQTREYFEREAFFGLPAEDVMLFSQGMLPVFDFEGRILMEARHQMAMAPDGHGGSLRALVRSGALRDMRTRGIGVISYFQVDNPLVKPFDPLFIGLHATTGSEMSTKVTSKADDLERVGNVCLADGKTVVIEYSDFPDSCARARNDDGTRRFDAGNLAIHLLNVDFVDRVVEGPDALPFRRAEKVVCCIDDAGQPRTSAAPNGVKLEKFIFDALPAARNPLVFEVDRAEEFSPVKNATGVDSLESAKRDQVARACRWLEEVGVVVPRSPDGVPAVTLAIAPSFALDMEDVRAQAAQLPSLKEGDVVFLT